MEMVAIIIVTEVASAIFKCHVSDEVMIMMVFTVTWESNERSRKIFFLGKKLFNTKGVEMKLSCSVAMVVTEVEYNFVERNNGNRCC